MGKFEDDDSLPVQEKDKSVKLFNIILGNSERERLQKHANNYKDNKNNEL